MIATHDDAAPGHAPTTTTHVSRKLIKAPVETVWSILTKTDEALPFFFGGICETVDGLHPGAKMRMVHRNRKIAMVVGEVLAFEPPHLYSHTFRMTTIDEPPCVVTYRLAEHADGCEFSLTIDRAVPGSKLEKQMLGAQGFIGANLRALAETGRPALSGRMVGLLSPLSALLAKPSQRIGNWPLD